MRSLNIGLAIAGWASILVLQVVLMHIARFFERNSGKPTWYRSYLITIALSGFAAGRYIVRMTRDIPVPDFTSDPIANLALFFAGVLLVVLGSHLYEEMMGGSP